MVPPRASASATLKEGNMSCQEELKKLLANAGLKYECRGHPEEYTAIAVAHSEGIPPAEMAKVVMCVADEGFAMFVIPASCRLDMINAANVAGVKSLRLAHEDEFEARFPGCEVGAMPPFGNLYGIPTFVDPALIHEPEIVFQAGSHTETIAMKPSGYLEASGAEVGKLVCDAPEEEHQSGLLVEVPL